MEITPVWVWSPYLALSLRLPVATLFASAEHWGHAADALTGSLFSVQMTEQRKQKQRIGLLGHPPHMNINPQQPAWRASAVGEECGGPTQWWLYTPDWQKACLCSACKQVRLYFTRPSWNKHLNVGVSAQSAGNPLRGMRPRAARAWVECELCALGPAESLPVGSGDDTPSSALTPRMPSAKPTALGEPTVGQRLWGGGFTIRSPVLHQQTQAAGFYFIIFSLFDISDKSKIS